MLKLTFTNKSFPVATVLLFSMLLTQCSTTENQRVGGLYNIDSLIENQINSLISHQAVISKKAILNNVEKITTRAPKDSLEWGEELAVFLELAVVNKPTNRETYKVENYGDNESNLSVKSFTTTEDIPVKFLRIFYQKSLSNVRKIEAQYDEENSLYASTRFLTMEFENIKEATILTSYSVEGGQKMFLDDSVQYWIGANIALKK